MFDVVLYQPEIAPNTGNVMRLCTNAGARLHLIEPLGFEPDDAKLRRAGLDYHDWTQVRRHTSWDACARFLMGATERRILAFSTRGSLRYDKAHFRPDDIFMFGPETRGLPQELLDRLPPECRLRLPMQPNNRSLNLSNTVAIAVYEGWRQLGFGGGS
jgi:tRNA (cytidine/uridine-2'-O-)-methyltransferase